MEIRSSPSELAPLIRYAEEGKVPKDAAKVRMVRKEAANYEVIDGVLMRIWGGAKGKAARCLLVVPESMREQMIKGFHDDLGHYAADRTVARMRERFWWPHMWRDTAQWVASCETCQRRARPTKDFGLLKPTVRDPEGRDGSHWYFDLAGPLPASEGGYSYLLVIRRRRSGWVSVYPLRSKRSEEIVARLRDEAARAGVPDGITSDRAQENISAVAQRFYESYGIVKYTTTARHPQADGAAESAVKIVKQVLGKLVNGVAGEWERYLPTTLMAINSAHWGSSGTSPFELETGRKMKLPIHFTAPP